MFSFRNADTNMNMLPSSLSCAFACIHPASHYVCPQSDMTCEIVRQLMLVLGSWLMSVLKLLPEQLEKALWSTIIRNWQRKLDKEDGIGRHHITNHLIWCLPAPQAMYHVSSDVIVCGCHGHLDGKKDCEGAVGRLISSCSLNIDEWLI